MNKLGLNQGATTSHGLKDDVQYKEFLSSFQHHFDMMLAKTNIKKVFTTNAEGLWDLFINNIDEAYRQHYTCNCCRQFITRFGNLVFLDEEGRKVSAIWSDEAPELFKDSLAAVRKAVEKAEVNGIFVTDKRVLGTPHTGAWTHFAVTLPYELVTPSHKLYTPYQIMCDYNTDFQSACNALNDFDMTIAETAVEILKSDVLFRSEKFLGIAQWFYALHKERARFKDERRKRNIVWAAVATAPKGFSRIKSSVIGTLLEDIRDGYEFNVIKSRFEEKVAPENYQRPQAAPSSGNVKRAEEIFAKLGIGTALERRFARLEELNLLWKPKEEEKKVVKNSLFGHIETKDAKKELSRPKMDLPTTTITWDKFNRTVLPEADKIELFVERISPFFSGILTAKYEDAKPIIKWDSEDKRNPFSHYLYMRETSCATWNLERGWTKVTGICYQPSMWQEGFDFLGKAVNFILEGCKDTNYRHGFGHGNSLFPEILIPELHEVRATVEAYSASAPIEGYDEASACGYRLQEGNVWNTLVRVTSNGTVREYKLDRWD